MSGLLGSGATAPVVLLATASGIILPKMLIDRADGAARSIRL